MCLIIQRDPNVDLDFEDFKTAVENNPDGYGLTFPDEGKLNVYRTPEKPSADSLFRTLDEDLKDKPIMLHLRFTTAGETNLRNAHPFPILEKNKDGVDLRMCHNGTLSRWDALGEKSESDTRAFVRLFVRPLFKRLIKGSDPEFLLNDPFTKFLLEDQLTTRSVLSFMDSEGNKLICNPLGNGGSEEKGVYFSNVYSFSKSLRTPSKITYPNTHIKQGVKQNNQSKNAVSKPVGLSHNKRPPLFSTVYKVKSSSLSLLRDETISEICKKPAAAELLIKELSLLLNQKEKKK